MLIRNASACIMIRDRQKRAAKMTLPTVSVAVFAYNEAKLIADCLDSIEACAGEAKLSVFVMINGCTDSTEQIVCDYAVMRPNVHPVVLRLGDKANAWNHYTHEVSEPDAAIHAFIDGDVTITRGSMAALVRSFADNPDANGCGALPVGCRPRVVAFGRKLRDNREMAGNFYALRGSFVQEFRRRQVRLPIGMFGEDGLLTLLARWDLDRPPDVVPRIAVCETAGFRYEPLSPWRPSDWRIARNRMMRYAMRRQQVRMLYPLLWSQGVAALPEQMADLYEQRHALLTFEWRGVETLFDRIAIRQIRRDVALGESAKAEDRAHVYS